MQYLKHDFFKNFSGSIKSGDNEYAIDIFINEISDLITHAPEKLFDLFEKTGIKLNKTVSDEKAIDGILEYTESEKKNHKFIKGLSFLIAEQNELISSKIHDTLLIKQLNSISNYTSKLFDYIHSNEGLKQDFKDEVLNAIVVKSKNVPQRSRPLKTNNRKKVIITILVISGILVAGYFIYKYIKNKNAQKLADGGVVPEVTQPEAQTATNQVSTQTEVKKPIDNKVPAQTVTTTTTIQPNEFGNLPDGVEA